MNRRHFLRKCAFWGPVAGMVGVLGYTWRVEPHWVEVVHRELPIAHLPESLIGKTLVQISDLHIGPVVEDDFLIGALQQVATLQPDILAITGDFMTCKGTEELAHAEQVLRHLQPARLATVAILGNHDYGSDWKQPAVADATSELLTGLGMQVLRDAKLDVDGLTITGLDDLWSPRFNGEKVLQTLRADRANLVLTHNPDMADRRIWAGYRGWILSGHTHGGQCKPPWMKPPVLPIYNHRYHAGEVDLGDGRWLYVNRALGYLKRVRFNVRPEITVFTLQAADAHARIRTGREVA